jgi:uncharacterized protein YndB with AHSA1/START domain
MMNHFQQTLTVAASPADVYAALTTIDGLRNWWSQDCDGSSEVGGTIHFRFGTCFNDMRVDQLDRNKEVRWHCTRAHTVGDAVTHEGEWVGTAPVFHLRDAGQGKTEVHFEHIGLVPALQCYGMCLKGWAHFLASLQQYVETGEGTPYVGNMNPASHSLERSAAA